jgi:hypothetical protein
VQALRVTKESRAVHVVWAGIARADNVEQSWRLGTTERVLLSVEDLGYQRGGGLCRARAGRGSRTVGSQWLARRPRDQRATVRIRQRS